MTAISMNLRLPFYEAVRDGLKTVEIRPCDGKFAKLSVGDTIEFSLDESPEMPIVSKRISLLQKFPSFEAAIRAVGRESCLPGMFDDDEAALGMYLSFPNYPQRAAEFGVVAIHLSATDAQI